LILAFAFALAATADAADAAYRRGDLGAAAELARAATRSEPASARAWLVRGLVEEEVRPGAGAPSLARAEALAPSDVLVLWHHAESLLARGELEPALERLARAIAIDPRAAAPHYLLAELHRRRGELDQAAAEYRVHAALDPTSGAHHDLGDLALAAGDRARALDEYARDLASHPDCLAARLNRAALELAAGRPRAAADEYERSLTFHPEDPQALEGLGRAYQALHLHGRAIRTLAHALALDPARSGARRALYWSQVVRAGMLAAPIVLLLGAAIGWRAWRGRSARVILA
jgi:tetratricopeptide (TPR) repeat protein